MYMTLKSGHVQKLTFPFHIMLLNIHERDRESFQKSPNQKERNFMGRVKTHEK